MNHSKCFISIGAGNVATHLVRKLCNSGYRLIQVYSRTADSANSLAEPYHAGCTISLSEIIPDADFYLVSLPDQVIPHILAQVKIKNKLIFHTAGSLGLEVFGKEFRNFGIMYPLQTFNKKVEMNIALVPIFIEANDKHALEEIENIARVITEKVYITDSEIRKWIHLAGVFASNFTNHMLVISSEILREKKLDPALIKPLIEETFRKSLTMDPSEAQTGPALRNDTETLSKHIKMLENRTLLQKIYTFTSESILYSKSSKQNISGK